MRPEPLAEHVADKLKALLAARDLETARREAALQKDIQELQYTVATLQRDLTLLEAQRTPSR